MSFEIHELADVILTRLEPEPLRPVPLRLVKTFSERRPTVAPSMHGLTQDSVLALSDNELVRQVYEWVARLDDETAAGALEFLLTEAFERFAPEAELAESERRYRAEPAIDAEFEFEATRQAMRARAGARMIR